MISVSSEGALEVYSSHWEEMVSAYRQEESPFSDFSFTSVEPARGVVDRGEAEFRVTTMGSR